MRFIFTLVLLVLMSGTTVFAQEDPAPQPKTCEPAAEVSTGREAFSLHKALGAAQNVKESGKAVVVPTGLPGATQSENTNKDAAITGFTGLLQRIINGLTGVAASVAVFFIVFNSGGMILAAGDTEKIKKSRTAIVWALLGLLLIMGSYIIAKTAISLTYSGTVAEECIDPASPEGQAILAEQEINNRCENIPAAIPQSCYSGGYNSSSLNGDEESCNATVNASPELASVCEFMQIDRDACSIAVVQNEVSEFYAGDGCRVPAGRADHADGEYGTCTEQAIGRYIDSQCSGDTESSS